MNWTRKELRRRRIREVAFTVVAVLTPALLALVILSSWEAADLGGDGVVVTEELLDSGDR